MPRATSTWQVGAAPQIFPRLPAPSRLTDHKVYGYQNNAFVAKIAHRRSRPCAWTGRADLRPPQALATSSAPHTVGLLAAAASP